MVFADRISAAHRLVAKIGSLTRGRPLVLGVPRGGVPMAKVIANALDGDLDIVLAHKVGHPAQPEFALGAVTEGGAFHIGTGAERFAFNDFDINRAAHEETRKLREKRRLYSGERAPIAPTGRLVIVVDDGVATGATMTAAVRDLKAKGAAHIIVATPVASPAAIQQLSREGAEVCTLLIPTHFFAVGQFYDDFNQVSDSEVIQTLNQASVAASNIESDQNEITIEHEGLKLRGLLNVPESAQGLVVFSHGSGSSRHSPRNQFIAHELNEGKFATLLLDLLTDAESIDRKSTFDIERLAQRLLFSRQWIEEQANLKNLNVGLFGASTGAGAALKAASYEPRRFLAIVSRGGRPDLAAPILSDVRAPTLLIIGGEDRAVIEMNEEAYDQLRCIKKIEIVPGAGHLFEEPGGLEKVATLTRDWFKKYLRA